MKFKAWYDKFTDTITIKKPMTVLLVSYWLSWLFVFRIRCIDHFLHSPDNSNPAFQEDDTSRTTS